ncbi:MAG: delta-aminolevulinic acid dehydratase [Microcystaceae cyanobacterium]
MVLIDSSFLQTLILILGTLLFAGLISWAVWFAFNMD